MTRWSKDLCFRYARRTAADILGNCMGASLSPLCCIIGFDPTLQLKWCSMHIVNLGVLQIHSGSCMSILLENRSLHARLCPYKRNTYEPQRVYLHRIHTHHVYMYTYIPVCFYIRRASTTQDTVSFSGESNHPHNFFVAIYGIRGHWGTFPGDGVAAALLQASGDFRRWASAQRIQLPSAAFNIQV